MQYKNIEEVKNLALYWRFFGCFVVVVLLWLVGWFVGCFFVVMIFVLVWFSLNKQTNKQISMRCFFPLNIWKEKFQNLTLHWHSPKLLKSETKVIAFQKRCVMSLNAQLQSGKIRQAEKRNKVISVWKSTIPYFISLEWAVNYF